MYTSFSVKNYRCFQDIKIGTLKRVNLFAGKNNVGKTALLEALWLHGAPDVPELGLRINRFRGRGTNSADFYKDLFHNYKYESMITLSARGDWGRSSRNLTIQLRERQLNQLILDEIPGDESTRQEPTTSIVGESPNEIILSYVDEAKKNILQ